MISIRTNIFKLIDLDYNFNNIGYINNLLVPNACGINGLALTTDENETIVLDDNLNYFNQDYYTFIGNDEYALYVYPSGSIKIYKENEFNTIKNINVIEAFMSDDKYYVVDNNRYLYQIDSTLKPKKMNQSKVLKIGYRTKNDVIDGAIIIFDDATARTFKVNIDSIPLK